MQNPASVRAQQLFQLQQQQLQQQPQQQQMDPSVLFAPSTTAATPSQPTSATAAISQASDNEDTELSNILNQVIEIAPDFNNGTSNMMLDSTAVNFNSPLTMNATQSSTLQQQEIDANKMIDAITKSLMQFDSSAYHANSPPAYSMHNSQQGFPPPPVYSQTQQQRPIQRMQSLPNHPGGGAGTGGTSGNGQTTLTSSNALRLQQIQRERLQQQQKERLLQQQQKQSLVVPSNATAGADQMSKCTFKRLQLLFILVPNVGISSYESLLNNVPPNVSLQRSSSVVNDSQLSPGFNQNMIQQQLSPSPRGAPFSPQSNPGKFAFDLCFFKFTNYLIHMYIAL